MMGAIIGDIVGSVYEWHNIKTKDFPLFREDCFFTDDTVMTCAVAEAVMNGGQKDDFIDAMKKYARMYPDAGYGGRFGAWLFSDQRQPYNSFGNGSAMRVSSVGWFYPSLEKTLFVAELTAKVTHNHPEGIKGAASVAAAIYLLRTGKDKNEVRSYIEDTFHYHFQQTLDEIRLDYQYNASCQETVPQAMTAFWESYGFEDCIRKAVSLGGDCDTLTAIAGSIAEAYYGIPDAIKKEALDRLDERLRGIYQEFLIWRLSHD